MIENIILVVILILIVGGAGLYIYSSKKKGKKCIGCPYAKQCSSHKCNVNSSVKRLKK
jgi:hypothetical protein